MLEKFHAIQLSYMIAFFIFLVLFVLFLWDLFQKKHTILRTYPIIGYFRYFAEYIGVFLRQFIFAREREELPFNRAERTWVYEASENIDTTVGFGSTRDNKPIGTIYFVDAPFPVLKRKMVEAKPITIGENCRYPYSTCRIINISAMSYGAISKNAILALAEGAKMAGCWLNTGEGGLSSYHLKSGCDLVAQIGTAKYGYHDSEGNLSDERLQKVAAFEQIKMFEIKLSQGAKPGLGGILTGVK